MSVTCNEYNLKTTTISCTICSHITQNSQACSLKKLEHTRYNFLIDVKYQQHSLLKYCTSLCAPAEQKKGAVDHQKVHLHCWSRVQMCEGHQYEVQYIPPDWPGGCKSYCFKLIFQITLLNQPIKYMSFPTISPPQTSNTIEKVESYPSCDLHTYIHS